MNDMFGNEIKCGHVICYAKNSTMQAGIVLSLEEHHVLMAYIGKTVAVRDGAEKTKDFYNDGTFFSYEPEAYYNKEYIAKKRVRYDSNRFILLKDPVCHLDNPNVVEQIKVMDLGKDLGILPKDYELGRPF